MNLNPFKKMNRKETLVFTVLQLASFAIIYILARTVWSDIYLLEWTADELYLYIWIPVILLSLSKKTIIASALTIGNVFGILLGQLVGDAIKYSNMQKIIEVMKEEQRYYLMSHKGVYLWIFTILIFLIFGVFISSMMKRKQQKCA
jgi:hypothetical protein